MTKSPPILRCKCCSKSSADVQLKLATKALLGGYSNVEWSDSAKAPEAEDWRRSDNAPVVGTKRIVCVSYPTRFLAKTVDLWGVGL